MTEDVSQEKVEEWAQLFGRLSEGSTSELALSTRNVDMAVGEVLIIPSTRGGDKRVFLFRAMDYSNILRRVRDMPKLAGTLVVEGDAYLAGVDREKLLYVNGQLLGYAEKNKDGDWSFNAPRRLPEHFAPVYRPIKGESEDTLKDILSSQISGEIFIGRLLAGEEVLDLDVYIPSEALPIHLGIFGTTGAGKSNLLMVLLKSMVDYNYSQWKSGNEPRVSMLAIDPHDEFALGIEEKGLQDVVNILPDKARRSLFGDFYYLTSYREAAPAKVKRYTREMRISKKEILPLDITSTMEVSDQMISYMNSLYTKYGDNWIKKMGADTGHSTTTVKAMERRISFIERSSIFVEEPEQSILKQVISALEGGRTLVFNTSLLSDMEQFITTTILARTIFELRKAVKSSTKWDEFQEQLYKRRLTESFRKGFRSHATQHYKIANEKIKTIENLPPILITIEEAPSLLTPRLMRFENIYKDIARQGRKFNIGLAVISQQVSVLDRVILSQINTQFNMLLTNADEIRDAIKNASKDISGYNKEFKVLSRGQYIMTASYRDTPLVLYVPKFDDLYQNTQQKYQKTKTTKSQEKQVIL